MLRSSAQIVALSNYINTFGQHLLQQHGERIHKIALDVGFTCPNRDGSKGIGGCTFCNNSSFSPNGKAPEPLEAQMDSGRHAILRRTRAKKYLAYFASRQNWRSHRQGCLAGIPRLRERMADAV
ncbi:MAG: hypothetical protein Fur0026_07180 [Sideroxydans sp.]